MNQPLYFIIPDVNTFISGGNIYNKNLINELERIGFSPIVMDMEGFKNCVDYIAEGICFFDTLFLPQLSKFLSTASSSVQYYLIVHHLESLYPPKGISGATYFKQQELPFLVHFNGFLTSSTFTADYLLKNGLNQPKIIVPPAMVAFPSKLPSKPASPIIALIVANLVERKGILSFLQTLANSTLIQAETKIQIHLIGSDRMEIIYANSCLAFLNKNPSLEAIMNYHGAISPPQLLPYFEQANLFISTSFMETYGMALQEARAFQLPILALTGGNIGHHIKNGVNGYIVEDMEQLVLQLEEFVKNKATLANLQLQIEASFEREVYNWKAAASRFVQQLVIMKKEGYF